MEEEEEPPTLLGVEIIAELSDPAFLKASNCASAFFNSVFALSKLFVLKLIQSVSSDLEVNAMYSPYTLLYCALILVIIVFISVTVGALTTTGDAAGANTDGVDIDDDDADATGAAAVDDSDAAAVDSPPL